jgi:hypothetical protein
MEAKMQHWTMMSGSLLAGEFMAKKCIASMYARKSPEVLPPGFGLEQCYSGKEELFGDLDVLVGRDLVLDLAMRLATVLRQG